MKAHCSGDIQFINFSKTITTHFIFFQKFKYKRSFHPHRPGCIGRRLVHALPPSFACSGGCLAAFILSVGDRFERMLCHIDVLSRRMLCRLAGWRLYAPLYWFCIFCRFSCIVMSRFCGLEWVSSPACSCCFLFGVVEVAATSLVVLFNCLNSLYLLRFVLVVLLFS